jgi:tetratricopeptide (TPR) repeat protein
MVCGGFAQHSKTDSLIRILRYAQEDSGKVNQLNELARLFLYRKYDTSLILLNQALPLAEKIKFHRGMGNAYQYLGNTYFVAGQYSAAMENYQKALAIGKSLEKEGFSSFLRSRAVGGIANVCNIEGNYKSALKYYAEALSIAEKAGDKEGLATHLGNIGTVYKDQADYSKALDFFLRALRMNQELKSNLDISRDLGNIGSIYFRQGDYPKALDYYHKALEIDEPAGNKAGVARQQANLGCVYLQQGEYDNALAYFTKALNTLEALGDKAELASQLCNIGSVYHEKLEHETALNYYLKALEVSEANNLNYIISILNENIGAVYLQKNDYIKAEAYLKKALSLSIEQNDMEGLRNVYLKLSQVDSLKGDFKMSFHHFKQYIAARDNITNEENTKKQTQLEMQFEFDKKQAADSVLVAEEKKLAFAELKSEKNKSYSLYGGLFLVLIFAGVMYNRFRVTQKQKRLIEEQKLFVEHQKKIVEERNKDVMDSIYYASRIQRSLLPTEKYIRKIFEQ